MTETVEIGLKLALCLIALGVVIWHEGRGRATSDTRAPWPYVALAIAAVAAYFNFGSLHGGGKFVHFWEHFHYNLGSKYFAELGYDGLYVASMRAERETVPKAREQRYIRDLRTNVIVDANTVTDHADAVLARFSPERWRDFVRDHSYFIDTGTPEVLAGVRRDHGYNPSPTWTFVGGTLASLAPTSAGCVGALAALDLVLLATMFVVLFRTYGARAGCLSLIVFGLGYGWRYYWVGGTFLRQDWLAAAVIGICMLRRGRHATAGLLIGIAAMLRVFPVLLLFGPAIAALEALLGRRDRSWLWRFTAGVAVSVVLGLGTGALAGRGVAGWREFKTNISQHSETWITNNVGLKNVVFYELEPFVPVVFDPPASEIGVKWRARLTRVSQERRVPYLLLAAALLALSALAARGAPLDETAMLGIVPIYALTLPTCYYWVFLLLIPLSRAGPGSVVDLLVMNAGLLVLHFVEPGMENRFGMMSWALLPLLVAWTAPAAWRSLRRSGTPP